MGVKVVMIKAGHRGAYIRTGDIVKLNSTTALKLPAGNWSQRKLWVESFPADPRRFKNACGAGDCAIAGFLTAVLKGLELEPAGRCAMLAGRDNLYGLDAFSGLSSWAAMTRIAGPFSGGGTKWRRIFRDSVKIQTVFVKSQEDRKRPGQHSITTTNENLDWLGRPGHHAAATGGVDRAILSAHLQKRARSALRHGAGDRAGHRRRG
jgi:hypothetical protein